MGVVYCLTSPSGRQYVGYTLRGLSERLAEHCCNLARSAITNAIKKYGLESFKVEILLESHDREVLAAREIEEILARNSLEPNGYNLTSGGDGCRGLTKSTRDEIARKVKGKWENDDYRDRRNRSLTAYWEDPGVRQKQSEALKRYYSDPSAREAASSRAKVALAIPENKARHAAACKAAWSNEELRRTSSLKAASLWTDAATRQARSADYKVKFGPGTEERKRLREQAREAAVPVMIDGVLYRSVPDAAEDLSLSNSQVEYRCLASQPKWKNWFKVRKEDEPRT